jgi:hypothetical protein
MTRPRSAPPVERHARRHCPALTLSTPERQSICNAIRQLIGAAAAHPDPLPQHLLGIGMKIAASLPPKDRVRRWWNEDMLVLSVEHVVPCPAGDKADLYQTE